MDVSPLLAVAAYFVFGAVLLSIFDMMTGRIRPKLAASALETQSRLITSGNYIGSKAATVLFLGIMYLFWPMVFVGALIDLFKKEDSRGA